MKMRLPSVLHHSVVIFLFIAVALVRCQNSVNYRLPTSVVPSIYDLHISVDLENLKFNGSETIYVDARQPTSTIELHLLDLFVDDVQVSDGANAILITSQTYNSETQIYRIALGQSLTAERGYEVKIDFNGDIRDDMKGLYRSSYYETGAVKYMATTFSAAAFARKIFPCFDEPAFKAEFRLSITNKDNYVTLANTRLQSVVRNELDNGEVWTTSVFQPTPIMSTYLLAFAVSEFQNMTQFNPSEFSVYSSRKAMSSMQYALDMGAKALQALEEYVGHRYTLGKMDFIAIDDFLMGAMENWGLVSFKSSRIMKPDGKRNRRRIQGITNIVSHELVHMFFGNQVTCEYWDYVWLNEGFASYLEYVIADKLLPRWHILDYFVVNRMHAVMLQDVKPKTHAMTRPINTPDEISKIYDFVAYPKAASVIRMIEHIMSPEMFQESLNSYILERSYKAATDEQLYESLERGRRENSNYPSIPEIFRSWANAPGYPILNVEVLIADKAARVRQELFVPFINSTESSEFYILYNYASSANAFGETSATNWIHKEAEMRHPLDNLGDDARWVVFNIQQTGYYRVNYDNRNWIAIIDELNGANFNSIHELNRAQLLDDSFNLARSDYLNFDVALNLLKYLKQETSLVALVAGLKSIDFLLSSLDQESFFKDLRAALLSIVDELYVRINNLSVASDDEDYHALTKLHVNSFACRVGAATCLKDATRKLFLFDYEYKEVDVDERPFLYCGVLGEDLASYNYAQLKLKIFKANGNEELYRDNQEEFNEIFDAFSTCDQNLDRVERLLNDIFNYVNETFSFANISRENALQVVGNLIRTSSAHRSLMMKFYSENFFAVTKKFDFKETLSMFAEAINTPAHLESFKSLATAAGLSTDESMETIAAIEENIRWMTAKAHEIAKWVNGSTVGAKLSILSVVAFVFVMVLQ